MLANWVVNMTSELCITCLFVRFISFARYLHALISNRFSCLTFMTWPKKPLPRRSPTTKSDGRKTLQKMQNHRILRVRVGLVHNHTSISRWKRIGSSKKHRMIECLEVCSIKMLIS